MRLKLCIICVLLSITSLVSAQTAGRLPMGLKYFMSPSEVEAQLSALSGYQIQDEKANTLAYMVPDESTETKNGLFLKFSAKGLVEIASMKTDMNKTLYDRYMDKMLRRAKAWKEAGIETVWEDDKNTIYIYRGERSRISISGSEVSGGNDQYSVSLTFTEAGYSQGSQ